jgi:hypothetical protein
VREKTEPSLRLAGRIILPGFRGHFGAADAMPAGTISSFPHFLSEAVTRRSTRRLSRIAKGLRTRCSNLARARIAKGGGLFDFLRRQAPEARIGE